MPVDYNQGKIYTIRSHDSDLIYVGSTTQSLARRLAKHKGSYKHYKKDGLTHKLSGPAIIYRSGTVKYFIEGVELSEADHSEHYLNSTGL